MLFGNRIMLLLIKSLRVAPLVGIPLVIAAIINSRNVAYTRLLLSVLVSLPEEILEEHEHLRVVFCHGPFADMPVKQVIKQYRTVLYTCFAGGR